MTLDEMIRESELLAQEEWVGKIYYTRRLACLRAANAELDALRAVVAKLPRTADGVPMVLGDEVFCVCGRDGLDPHIEGPLTLWCPIDKANTYSTRAAAEAALKEKGTQ